GNYEYERQPLTSIWSTPYQRFNVELDGIRNVKLGGVRADEQLSPKMRVMGKISHSGLLEPFGPGGGNHPSATNSNQEHNTDVIGQFTHVISNRAVNEVRFGYASYGIDQRSLTSWSKHWQAANGGPVPADIEALFPDAFNADTWNLAAISSITTRYTVGVSDATNFLTPIPMWKYGAWAQDDWRLSNHLTVNLGLRYDLIWNAF